MDRYLNAQNGVYPSALQEIKNGKKESHWMWFIFPQISGLGNTDTSKLYAIKNKEEAETYLSHPVLGARLIDISNELLKLKTNDPVAVFGSIDSMKLRSSMTLFSLLSPTDPVFKKVLDKFFNGEKDERTVQLLNQLS